MAMHAFCPARCTAVLTRTRYVENGKHCNRTLISSQARQRTINVRAQGQQTATKDNLQTVTLPAKDATPENFAPFGQVISATPDGKAFDNSDAALILNQGTPRFYIMRIPKRGLTFDRITYHDKVTQCLGGLGAEDWYLVVSAPSGSVESAPTEQDLHAFKIQHGQFVKLHRGTWHAGPLFDDASHMDFYNLELSDTNQADHNTHVYSSRNQMQFTVSP